MKGISIIERHFEKAVLALIAIGIGGFALVDAAGLLRESPKIGGKSVDVSQIGDELRTISQRVEQLQKGTEVPFQIPALPAVDASTTEAFDKPVDAGAPIPRAMPPLAKSLFSKANRPIPLYHEPTLGAAWIVTPVQQRDGAVKIATDDAGKALSAFLDKRPEGWDRGDANVIWTTPTAELDLSAIRAEFERSDSKASPARERLPVHWWQQRTRDMVVLDVVFERQERQADGSWGPSTIVDPMPGAFSLRGKRFTSAGTVLDALKSSDNAQDQILRPALPPMASGQAAPSAAGAPAAAPVSRKLADARAAFETATRNLEQKTADLDKAGGPYDGPPKGGRGGGTSGGTSGGGGGKGGAGGGAGRNNDEGDPNVLRKRRMLTVEVEKLKAEVAALKKKLDEVEKAESTAASASTASAGSDRMTVWTNDFQVRPGAEYRYRCQVEFMNPFLGRRNELQPSQQKLDGASSIRTAASDWATVRVRSPREFFALEATAGEGTAALGMGRFELFKLDGGSWRGARDMIEFGDRVGGPIDATDRKGGKVDFTTDWYVIGVYRDVAAEATAGRSGSERPMMLVLASASDPAKIIVRRPATDGANPSRNYLSEQTGGTAVGAAAAASGSGKGG